MLKTGMLIRSAGFETPGVPEHINVISATVAANLTNCVKTASGFGGCNAAINLNRE
jgi:3-oxoacyl-[acyl-carrier-protein] synthase-1